MVQRITAQISDDEAAALDEAVASGRFPSRAAAVRAAIALLNEESTIIDGELVLPEPPDVPAAQQTASPVELARRAIVPLVGAGAVGLVARLARRRREPAPPLRRPKGAVTPPADMLLLRRVEEVWLRRR